MRKFIYLFLPFLLFFSCEREMQVQPIFPIYYQLDEIERSEIQMYRMEGESLNQLHLAFNKHNISLPDDRHLAMGTEIFAWEFINPNDVIMKTHEAQRFLSYADFNTDHLKLWIPENNDEAFYLNGHPGDCQLDRPYFWFKQWSRVEGISSMPWQFRYEDKSYSSLEDQLYSELNSPYLQMNLLKSGDTLLLIKGARFYQNIDCRPG